MIKIVQRVGEYHLYILLLASLALMFSGFVGGVVMASVVAVVLGLMLLVTAGDKLVESASNIGVKVGISEFAIGAIVIGFGTSMPEVITFLVGVISGADSLAFGSILGSNIANTGLILAFCILLMGASLGMQNSVKNWTSLLFVNVLAVAAISFYGKVDMLVALISLVILAAYVFYTLKNKDNSEKTEVSVVNESVLTSAITLALGFGGLLLGAKILVDGGVHLATVFGVSEKAIGLSIVAVGTSLPELAATFAAFKVRKADMILGNILGSNVFNILAAAGLGGLIKSIPTQGMQLDAFVMLAFTGAIGLLAINFIPRRLVGSAMVMAYMLYILASFSGNI